MLHTNQSVPHIIAVSETWLDDSIPDGVVSLQDFSTIFRKDRTNRRGGGVLLLIRNGLSSHRRPDLEAWPESVWLKCLLRYFALETCSRLVTTAHHRPNAKTSFVSRKLSNYRLRE